MWNEVSRRHSSSVADVDEVTKKLVDFDSGGRSGCNHSILVDLVPLDKNLHVLYPTCENMLRSQQELR